MKKFVLGVVSTLGAIVIGKKIYNKGRRDEAKETYEYLSDTVDTFRKGVELNTEIKNECDEIIENIRDKESE